MLLLRVRLLPAPPLLLVLLLLQAPVLVRVQVRMLLQKTQLPEERRRGPQGWELPEPGEPVQDRVVAAAAATVLERGGL